MFPELFRIPFTDITIKSYGLMLVIGFLCAIYVIKRLSRDINTDSNMLINAALYALLAGVVGARIFYVIHYFERFRGDLLSVFAVWQGGLELLGGVIAALLVIISYLLYHKLPVRKYLDILAIALLLALASGRIGCFLNGCCYGKPLDAPIAVRFPYGSLAYQSQIEADPARNRPQPYLSLPDEYFETFRQNGQTYRQLIPFDQLSARQQQMVTGSGPYACIPVHPTQLYSAGSALLLSFVLYLFWRRANKLQGLGKNAIFTKPGSIFGLLFVFYAPIRFTMEFIRDDNPFEIGVLTVSQNITIGLFIMGLILLIVFHKMPVRSQTSYTNKRSAHPTR